MTAWERKWLPEAEHDFSKFDASIQAQVIKGLRKVAENPLPTTEGGYGKPLRNGNKTKLAGLCKIKFRNIGVRVVYKPIRTDSRMLIIVVGIRADDEVYRIADNRRRSHDI
ncbi:type II toxin-antitoxin system RelE family toxin [Bifidobacterium parmae]|uniref:Toxin RelE n=1 Tax=Bifidobacterium parmae TaxID=361854 RepID=A0A2N5J5X1_9BIFI|nr:addiction module toxin RelE [Bifidobacterium parmae]PLS29614.1 toxin RelE [Bifidobacterium parmae]